MTSPRKLDDLYICSPENWRHGTPKLLVWNDVFPFPSKGALSGSMLYTWHHLPTLCNHNLAPLPGWMAVARRTLVLPLSPRSVFEFFFLSKGGQQLGLVDIRDVGLINITAIRDVGLIKIAVTSIHQLSKRPKEPWLWMRKKRCI